MHLSVTTLQDIKASNLLLKVDPLQPKGFVLKLADFGFSRCGRNAVCYSTRNVPHPARFARPYMRHI